MKKSLTQSTCCAALTGLLLLNLPPFIHAQALPKQTQSADPTKLSDREIAAFAKAYVAYHKLRQTYDTRIEKAQDPKEKEKIQREGDLRVKEVLDKQGLTPESYNGLFAAVNQNEQQRQKTLKMINEERSKS